MLRPSSVLFFAVAFPLVCVAKTVTLTDSVSVGSRKGIRTVTSKTQIPVGSKGDEGQIRVGHISEDCCGQWPARALSAALKQDKTSSQFRVSWNSFGVRYEWKSTALYNRKTKILNFYTSGDSGEAEHFIKNWQKWKLAKVKESYIQKIASAPDWAQTGGFTKVLEKAGAKVIFRVVKTAKG